MKGLITKLNFYFYYSSALLCFYGAWTDEHTSKSTYDSVNMNYRSEIPALRIHLGASLFLEVVRPPPKLEHNLLEITFENISSRSVSYFSSRNRA